MNNADITKQVLSVELEKLRQENAALSARYEKVIKEQKSVKKETSESRKRLNSLFTSMAEMAVIHELVFNVQGEAINYRIIDCNRAFTEITGIKKVDAVGKLATEVYQTETAPYIDVYSHVAITGQPKTFTTFYAPMDKHFSISVVSPKQHQFATVSIDITSMKRIDDNLRESEAKYRKLFSEMKNGCSLQEIICDLNGNPVDYMTLDVNAAFESLLDSSRDMVIGKKASEIIPQEELKNWVNVFGPVAMTGNSTKYENYSPLNNKYFDGIAFRTEPKKFATVFQDITQHKHVEESRLASELRYRRLFESAKDGILILDAETGKIVDVNPYLIEMLSYSKEQFIERAIWDIGFFKDIIANQDKFFELQQKECIRYEDLPLETADGRKINVEFVSNVYTVNTQKVIQCNIRNITDRKIAEKLIQTSEEKFRLITENSADAIFIVDDQGKYVYVNTKAVNMLGYSKEEMLMFTIADISTKNKVEKYYQILQQIQQKGHFFTELEFVKKDGTILPTDFNAVLLPNGFLYASCRDISERKRTEEELTIHRNNLEELVQIRTQEWNNANEELQIQIERGKEVELILEQSLEKEKELSEMQARFISTTSHEFRTPLTAVLSSTELLQRYGAKWDENKKNEHYKRIIDSIEYLTNLIDDVLTISRAETGKISFKPESVDLFELSTECVKEIKSLLKEKHELILNYNLTEKKFKLDRKLMRFIFTNLLSNATKYSPEGGIIDFSISIIDEYLLITVKDEGIGISSDEIGKIFDSFYRSQNTMTISGTGLGLAIVKRAVDLHSGKITVSSELGRGTSFIVKISIHSIEL